MEGVTQGYPFTVVTYGVGIILLIKHLKLTYPDVMQPWYADDAGELGAFKHLEKYVKVLKRYNPARG